MAPGTYVLGARVSADGARLVTDTFDKGFYAQVIDATTGAVVRDIRGAGGRPVFDASFLGDGRVMWLGEVERRSQVMVEGVRVSDAPYAALAAREANGTIRFLDREGWFWDVDEIAAPPVAAEAAPEVAAGVPPVGEFAGGPPIEAMDSRYWPWEHFFYPQQRAPTAVYISSGAPHIGAVFGGGDRLGEQRWSLAGYGQPPSSGSTAWHYAGDAEYLNEMLAPYVIFADVDFYDWVDPVMLADGKAAPPDLRRERDVTASITRTWRGSFTGALSGLYNDDFDELVTPERRHLGGPQLALSFDSEEDTRYVTPRRAVYAAATATFYPHELSTFSGEITDVGGSLGFVAPLPFGRRHTLAVDVRGRALLAQSDTGLLQLGGDTGLATLLSTSNETMAPPSFDASRFPSQLRFVETLRGYEDYAITTDRATIVDVSWRYPLIIDRGVAATLWVLPATFIQELDFELFGAGALDQQNDEHAAAGAAVTMQFSIWRFSLEVQYQIARRLKDDDAITQLIAVGPGT
jgi:hypothetical protein